MLPISGELESIVRRALHEDLSAGDVTTASLVPHDVQAAARVIPQQSGVIAGIQVAMTVFRAVDDSLATAPMLSDGARVQGGETAAEVRGRLASILMAERTALNFMQRMSGIATLTARYVEAVSGSEAEILDTRKTAPGLRSLDKYAVAAGGGRNHRHNLGDGVLIKDNHVAALRARGADVADIIQRARAGAPHTLKIEIEVESVDEAREAIEAGADIILLDNMPVDEMRQAARLAKGRCLTEASGNVTIENVAQIAATGVNMISVGALTHSPPAMNIGLEVVA